MGVRFGGESPNGPQTPCKQPAFSGWKRGSPDTLLTPETLCAVGGVYGGGSFHECKSYSELGGNRCNRVRCCDSFDWWSSIVWQFGIACRFRQRGPLCALVQFPRRLCLHRSRGGPSAVQALGRLYLTVRCGFHDPRLCGIWRSRYWRWGIREADHLRADHSIVILDCSDDCFDTCDEEDPGFGAVDHLHGFRMGLWGDPQAFESPLRHQKMTGEH